MNWDTNEVYNWAIDNENTKSNLAHCIGNELHFCFRLHILVKCLNKNGFEINESNVNGNEIYKAFLELYRNENCPHGGNEK